MKDDSLNDTQNNKYRPKCDKEHDWKFDCSVPKPQIVGIINDTRFESKLVRDIWNEAIEAAYLEVGYLANHIRKLKK